MNNTQIFARAASHGSQILVYQMNYESRDENAMILPLPIRRPSGDKSLRFIDLKNYADFFDDLVKGFPYTPPSFTLGCSLPLNPDSRPDLEVYNVGNYIASFVPELGDFSRLDDRFNLPENTWLQIPQYEDYGFAVFQLSAGSLKPHPMAFEFETASDLLYFPTLHIHDGKIHETEEFDHVLYLQHAGFDSRVYRYENSHIPDKSTSLVRSKYTAKHFCDIARSQGVLNPDLLVHRRLIRGDCPNRDTEIATFGDPTTPTLNLRPLWSFMPWVVIAAAAMWFLARRAKIKKKKTVGEISKDNIPFAERDRTIE